MVGRCLFGLCKVALSSAQCRWWEDITGKKSSTKGGCAERADWIEESLCLWSVLANTRIVQCTRSHIYCNVLVARGNHTGKDATSCQPIERPPWWRLISQSRGSRRLRPLQHTSQASHRDYYRSASSSMRLMTTILQIACVTIRRWHHP